MAAANRLLTRVLRGRRVVDATIDDDDAAMLRLVYEDGATMTVRTPDGAAAEAAAETVRRTLPSPPVKKTRQDDGHVYFDCDDGTTFAVPLAAATSSVFMREGDGTFAYAD